MLTSSSAMSRPTSERDILAISGPTASGKTSLAVEVALYLGGEIVNFDSVQIYRGIEIATAKPTATERCGVPHHLIDYVDPRTNYNAMDWAGDATAAILDIESRGRTPILVGGTGFYLRTLREPLFVGPATDENLRRRLQGIHAHRGAEYLHRLLKRVDPAAAASIELRDYVRSIRALEVYFQTGSRLSSERQNRVKAPEFARRIKLFVLNPPRDELYHKINRRTEEHFANGLVDEVERLRASGVPDDTNALGAHAYRRVCEYLRGERTLESALEKAQQDVRNYAKRQLTWFRRETDAIWLEGFGTDAEVRHRLLAHLRTI
ncbi:MAG: tRNA (adenosine(37)-N6)-dimethylallyltransferase MiaA [Pyrinomonadaceae bacterium]